MNLIWAALAFLIDWMVRIGLWVSYPFRSNYIPPTPVTVEVDYHRDYEWEADLYCLECLTLGPHLFIEWIEESGVVTTAQCRACGYEGLV